MSKPSAQSRWIKLCRILVSFLLLNLLFWPVIEVTSSQTLTLPENLPLTAEQQFYRERAFPAATVPADAWAKALEQTRQMPQLLTLHRTGPANSSPTLQAAGSWQALGPNASLTASGRLSGRVTAIAADPNDAKTLYIGTAAGGVWKTGDSGQTWTPLTDNQPSLSIGALTVDPTNANIVYAGTGEANNSPDSYYGIGLLKSSNKGASWTLLGASVFGNPAQGYNSFSKIVVNPFNNQEILAATSKGVYRSTDGGTNWTSRLSGVATDLVIDSNTSPATFYATLGKADGATANGIYKSTDGGLTFGLIGSGQYPAGTSAGRIALDHSLSSPQRLYAVIASPGSSFSTSLGVWTTTNGGSSWTQVTTAAGSGPNFCGMLCAYNLFIRVDPLNAQTVYLGGSDLYKSTDGGASWTSLSGAGTQFSPNEHFLSFGLGNSATLYLANDGGIWKSIDSGASWANLNSNLATLILNGGSAGPNFSATPLIYGAAQGAGILRYDGTSLDWPQMLSGNAAATAINFNNPQIVYAMLFNGVIMKSSNAGANWAPATSGITASAPLLTPLIMDQANPNRLLMGTTGKKPDGISADSTVYESSNGAASWTAISPDLGAAQALATAKSNGQVIYVATNNNNLWVTTNGGSSWNQRNIGLPVRFLKAIAVDPLNANRAVVTFSGFGGGHVYLTTNAGNSWTNISGNLPDVPVNTILIDPVSPNTFYIGTDTGFFLTTNAGVSWSALQNGLPNSPISQLFSDPQFSTIIAATHGRGMFSLCTFDPALPVVNSTDDNLTSDCSVTLRRALLQANPNATISFSLPVGSVINLKSALPDVPAGVSIVANYQLAANGRGIPTIRLDGGGTVANGLNLTTNSKIQGLAFTHFSDYALKINGSANTIYANYFGTADGNTALANGGGIWLAVGANNNLIGGDSTLTSPRYYGNLIAGNNGYGIFVGGKTGGNILKYNFIGYQADGITPLSNSRSEIFARQGLKLGQGNRLHN
jgi:photosystem II stability/assembly factor-like uncharacterized protein